MTTKQRAQLYHELSKLLGAGMHLDRSLEILLEQRPAAAVRDYLRGARQGLAERMTFTDAVASHNAGVVTPLEISLLAAGERGGRLEASCEHLASYFELRQKSKEKILGALIYPVILLHLGVLIPDLSKIVTSGGFEGQLSGILQRLVVIWILLGSLAAAGWLVVKAAAKSAAMDGLLGLLPLVGGARRHWALARFCQVFHTGLLAALRISEVVVLAGEASQSAVLHQAGLRIASKVEAGEALAPSLMETDGFPRSFGRAVDTAEQTGTLDQEMGRWARAESELAFRAQDRAAEWLPRIFYVLVLLYVASRIIGVFSGYYGRGGVIDQMLEGM